MEIKRKIDFLKKNKLSIFFKILQLIIVFVIFFAFNNVNIFGVHNPFGISILFAMIWAGYNAIIVGFMFAVTYYLQTINSVSLQVAIIVFLISIVIYFINKYKKIEYKYFSLYILCIISFLPYAIFNWGDSKQNVTIVISVLFALFLLYIAKYFLKGTIKRGVNLRLNPDEKICAAIVLILFTYGLSNIQLLEIEWATIFCVLFALLSSYIYGQLECIIISLVMGIGVGLETFNPIYISYFLCFGLFASAFKSNKRIFSAIAVIITNLFFTMYFTNYLIFSFNTLIAIVLICLFFLLLPKRFLIYLRDLVASGKNNVAVRNVVKSSKEKISKKLLDISNVFKEMEFSFKRTLQKTLPLSEKQEMMKQDIVESVCKDCPNRDKCLRANGEYTTKVFDSLIEAGVSKGRVGLVDLNNYLVSRCLKLNLLITMSNDIIKSYREYNILSKNMDCSKILVSEQFAGVSTVIKAMAKEVSEDLYYDVDLETCIKEDLLYKNIFCEDVVVYEKNLLEKNIILLIRNSKIDKKIIEKVVSKSCKNTVKITHIEPSELPNHSVVSLVSAPNYDIVFGSASCNKTGTIISGDTHSFIKIDNGKYMLALSDGMGSGSKARETSDLAINLIENYYKAGFDNDLILSSVNKLLSLNNEEIFSAIDLCIFDFFKNTIDFIKLGTPNSYIKKKTGVEIINSSGLPIGILEEIRPHITKKYIENFDIIILVSDGIVDAFGKNNLGVYINNLNVINPQEIADMILNKARAIVNNVNEDDMTVLVARIYPTK